MKHIIQLGTDWKLIPPCTRVQYQSYVDYRTQGNCLAITSEMKHALRFNNHEEAEQFLKSNLLKGCVSEINKSRKIIGYPLYEPQIIDIFS